LGARAAAILVDARKTAVVKIDRSRIRVFCRIALPKGSTKAVLLVQVPLRQGRQHGMRKSFDIPGPAGNLSIAGETFA
jgi:hypothetical protein